MKKIAILTALSVITLSSFAFSEDTATKKPVSETEKAVVKKDAKTMAKKMMNNAPKGTGSRSLARFNKIDTDKNGKISQAEFTNSHIVAFKKKDKNKDDVLDQSEFSPTLAKAAQATKN